MELSRRKFLKLTGAAAATAALVGSGIRDSVEAAGRKRVLFGVEVPTVCTFCGVGCGVICNVQDGVVVNTEGDPDHPINEGTLCSKGNSHYNISYMYDEKGRIRPNQQRVTQVLYRAPKSDRWEVKDWDWALDTIAQRIKESRDENYVTEDDGVTVNRTEAISFLGSAFCNNEENYLFHKMCRAIGIINLDHCARL